MRVLPLRPVAAMHADERASVAVWLTNLSSVVLPPAGMAAGVWLLWGHGFNWMHLAIVFAMYAISGFGITVGFHRYFSHRAFEAHPLVQWALAICGSMACQGPLLTWVATHRKHHHCSDETGDPHSPHLHGDSAAGVLRGWWHAHVGWIFAEDPTDLPRYVPDLLRQRWMRVVSFLWPLWVVLGLLIPAVLAGLVTRTWTGAMLGMLWGGLARIFLVHHITWSINSVCHLWGTRPFRSHDYSRNNALFGVIGLGEGWHNNHHAFPTSARHGLHWWQFDAGWLVIRALERCGLIWKVKTPSGAAMAAKRA